MSQPAETAIRTLFVTLKRGFAGKKDSQVKILKSLGLRRREQCVEKPNNSSVRGALDKVKHLVTVETDEQRRSRMDAERQRQELRPPIRVMH
jgi:large subunit ribosomal protein L30